MRIRRVLGVALAGLLLAGCATGASTTSKTISVDGGALVIAPAKTQNVVYGKQAALFDLEHSERLGGSWSVKEIDFGYVSIKHTVSGGAVATPKPRLAWVVFYDPGVFVSAGMAPTCPGGQPVRPAVSGRSAMIVDAASEASFFYAGAGTTYCGVARKPVVKQAYQLVSVPWVDLGGDRVRATYPGCAVPSGAQSTGVKTATRSEWRMAMLGHRAIGPCSWPPFTRVIELGFPAKQLRDYPRPWTHLPLGPQHG
jgi:hypothetical protein